MKKISVILVICISLCASFHTSAQAITNEDIKAQFLKDWQRAKDYTISYLNTMPGDRYSFKAVDSIRSFSQQMLHLAQVNAVFFSAITGEPNAMAKANLEGSATAQSRDSVVYYVTTSYDFAINSLRKLNASALGEKIKVFGMEETKFTWLLKAFEHQTHHRGQTTIYIRLLGIKPPQERLF